MRVLVTTDTVGGVWTYALELVRGLVARDVEVTLAALGTPSLEQRDEAERSGARFESRAYALEWMPDPWLDVAASGEWLLELAAGTNADVLHLNGFAHGALPWAAPVVVVAHSDVLSWWQAVHGTPAGPEWDRYAEAVAAGLAAADLVVAPTRAYLDELVRLYDPPGPRRVIPNGLERAPHEQPKEPFALGAGRLWDEGKNAAALARVAPRLPWPVLLAGEGPAHAHVRGLGRLARDELDDVLARASIFVAPALYEPFGLAVLEAARAGCALVLADLPSLREVWGRAALFVPPRDDDALTTALTRLAEQPELRAQLAAAAHRRSLAFGASRMVDAYSECYAQLRRRVAA